MTTKVMYLAAALAIVTAVTGCREDEKQSGKDAVREFFAEEDAKARERHKDFMRDWGQSKHIPTDPFATDPKPATPPKSPSKPAENPGGGQPPSQPASSHPAQQER